MEDRAISLNAVIDAIEFFQINPQHFDFVSLIDDIKELPSVQPKTGHWIYEPRKRLINESDEGCEYITDKWCKCSECGADFGYQEVHDKFCKFCGARMRG